MMTKSQSPNKKKTRSKGTTTSPATRSDGSSDGVPNTVPDRVFVCSECGKELPSAKAVDMHQRRKQEGRYAQKPPQAPGGEGVRDADPDAQSTIAEKQLRLKESQADLKLLKIQREIDRLSDKDPVEEITGLIKLKMLKDISDGKSHPVPPIQNDGRVSELERTVDELTHRYQLAQLQTDVESRVAEVEAHTRSRMARLEAAFQQRPPGDRPRTYNELESELSQLSLTEGFKILSKSLDHFSERFDRMNTRVDEVTRKATPLLTEILRRKLGAPEGMEDRERSIDDIPEVELLEMDRILQEKYGSEDYDRDGVTEEELEETREKATKRLRETKSPKKAMESAQESPSIPKPERMVLVLKPQRKRKGGK